MLALVWTTTRGPRPVSCARTPSCGSSTKSVTTARSKPKARWRSSRHCSKRLQPGVIYRRLIAARVQTSWTCRSRARPRVERILHRQPTMLCQTVVVELVPDHVNAATEWVKGITGALRDGQWTEAPPDAWSPRRTLDHLVDALLLYSAYIATRATDRITPPRNGDIEATPAELLAALRSSSSILVTLLESMPDDARAFHPSGLADRTGWIGMACTELLVHGFDIAGTTRSEIMPPDDRLARAVVERVFPWTPSEAGGWSQLLWATGRASLGTRSPQDAAWWWQSAPLADWDGLPRRRDAPPQW